MKADRWNAHKSLVIMWWSKNLECGSKHVKRRRDHLFLPPVDIIEEKIVERGPMSKEKVTLLDDL